MATTADTTMHEEGLRAGAREAAVAAWQEMCEVADETIPARLDRNVELLTRIAGFSPIFSVLLDRGLLDDQVEEMLQRREDFGGVEVMSPQPLSREEKDAHASATTWLLLSLMKAVDAGIITITPAPYVDPATQGRVTVDVSDFHD